MEREEMTTDADFIDLGQASQLTEGNGDNGGDTNGKQLLGGLSDD
ncbi:benenodin family lasso peptide [Sphingobium aromaticiconvertens]